MAGVTIANLLAESRRRYEAGDYDDALPLAQRARELAVRGSAPAEQSAAVQLAGEIAYSQGRYSDAGALATEALGLRQGAPGVDRAETLNLLGIVDLAVGDPAHGLARIEASLRLREAELGPDDPDTIESLNNRGAALGRLGRLAEAIAVHEDALGRCERAFDRPHRQLAVTCNALAVKLDREATTRDRAATFYVRGLDAAEAALGPDHPLVAIMVTNLAILRLNADDDEAARPLLERALALHEQRFGPDHPGTAEVLVSAAELAVRDGRLDEAEDLAARATDIRLRVYGLADQRTRAALAKLVVVAGRRLRSELPSPGLRQATDLAEALALFEAYRDITAADPARMPGGSTDMADGERRLRAHLSRAMTLRRPEDPAVRASLDRARAALIASDAALLEGDHETAVVAARQAVAHTEDARGPVHPGLIEPLRRLAALLRAGNDQRGALTLDRRVQALLVAAYGERHPFVLVTLGGIVLATARLDGRTAAQSDMARLRSLAASNPRADTAHLVRLVERLLEVAGQPWMPGQPLPWSGGETRLN